MDDTFVTLLSVPRVRLASFKQNIAMANVAPIVHRVGFACSKHCPNGHRAVAKVTWASPSARKVFSA